MKMMEMQWQKKKGLQKDVEYNIGYADGVVVENERIRSLL